MIPVLPKTKPISLKVIIASTFLELNLSAKQIFQEGEILSETIKSAIASQERHNQRSN